ncbi:MAG: SPOR domain-containing protein [Parasulfuritortus sp.]|nr:SPOR domain-containing protein [Parasulfuritortus sp.]
MKHQRGGTFLGFVLGLVIGLGVALAVAVYVTKVPVPFLDKGMNRPADQDAVEQQKNKDWDPNAPLYGKNPARPASAEQVETAAPKADAPATTAPMASAPVTAAPKAELKPAVTADPLGDLVKAKAAAATGAATGQTAAADPFVYFVQVGAFRTPEDAESQRAKLSLAGIETKTSEREQAGRTVYRVRMGPFDQRDDADKAKARLEAAGQDAALVRVAR